MDPHKLLGIKEGCTDKELKERYRKVCFLFHPDKMQQDPSAIVIFQLLTEAHGLIKNMRQPHGTDTQAPSAAKSYKKKANRPAPTSNNCDTTVGHTLQDPWFQQDFSLHDYFTELTVSKPKK